MGRRWRSGLAVWALALASCAGAPEAPPVALPFHVIAHRGASAQAPENTLPAFERARALGAVAVELDVQLSRDDVVVLFHDSTLDEKTDLAGPVRSHDATTLLRADIGSWFDARHEGLPGRYAGTSLTTLDALFSRFGAAFHYHVELKSREPELPERVLAHVYAHDLTGRVTLTSFHRDLLERARGLDPALPITWLLREPEDALLDAAVAEEFQMVAFPARVLDAALVRRARARGLLVRAWKVKTPEDMERTIRAGANGMTIDWPDLAIRRLVEIWDAGGLD